MEISHPWHDHPLFLSDEAKFEDYCYICKKRFKGEPFYNCVDCRYYVHKSCAQLPAEIRHHFHPLHPLTLVPGFGFACDSCHKSFRNELQFRCLTCDFNLDVKCATMSDIDAEGKEFIRHFTHQHPLTVCSKDGDNPLTCFACKKTSSDLIYGCHTCEYFLHKSCSEISPHVLHAIHPQHALSLAVKFGRCHYCKLDDHTWKYCCPFCHLYWDASCLNKYAKDSQNLERSCFICGKQHSDSASCINLLYFINQSCIKLPEEIDHEFHSHKPLLMLGAKDFECGSCHKWLVRKSHYGCEECNFRMDVQCALMHRTQYEEIDEGNFPVIPPHFSHQHPLQLIVEVDDINCSACGTTKVSPVIGCCKCEYFLHQSCIELPIQINHPLHHSHVLTFQHFRDNFCQICCRKYGGFGFGCIKCHFFIGIECIFELLPSVTVGHKYHRHPLYLIEKSRCDQCDAHNPFCRFFKESMEFKLTKSYSLRCIECNYNLHLLCGPLPCTIKHKSHRHVLTLVDGILEDYSDEYYCDVCEEIRSPRLCVYYCKDCQFFAHVHCIISEIINIFKKYLDKYEMRIVGDLRFDDTTDPSYDNSTDELLLDLLKSLQGYDMRMMGFHYGRGKLFPRQEKEYSSGMLEQISSSEDDSMDIIEELSFYGDDVYLNIEKRLRVFKPHTKYHIQPHECQLPVIEVGGYKVTTNFATISRALLMKYGDFFHEFVLFSKCGKSVFLYFLCRTVSEMCITYTDDITEKQLFTWLYYIRPIPFRAQLNFLKPFLDRITRSYFGLRAMKFEDEAIGRLDREIVKVDEKVLELKAKREELEGYRQLHKPGKIVEKSEVMKQFVVDAKLLTHKIAGEGII